MIASCTWIGVPQRFSDFFAALYHRPFSSKIAQMFSTFAGGDVEHPDNATLAIAMTTSPINEFGDRFNTVPPVSPRDRSVGAQARPDLMLSTS